MRKRKALFVGVVALLGVAALGLATSVAARPKAAPFKVAWIYPGPHNDGGWSQAHDAGRLYVQKMLGNKVQTTYKENVFSQRAGPADRRRTRPRRLQDDLRDLVRDARVRRQRAALEEVSEGHLRAGDRVAGREEPGRVLRFGRGHDLPVRDGGGRGDEEGRRSATSSRSAPAEVVRHTNAFTLGAQATHPGAKVKIIWTNAWYSPPKETAAAANLVASGADVLGQNVDSPAAGVYAEKHGIPWVGYDSNAQEVRAEAVADGLGLQLGPLLPAAREGRASTARGSRASTTARSTTASRSWRRTGRP